MNTRSLQKISTLEAPTLSVGDDVSAQLEEELSTREAFDDYELTATVGSGYVLPAMATQVVEVALGTMSSKAGAASASLAASAASSGSTLTYTWVKGVVVKDNKVIDGFYDANKIWGDSHMCWAASAANTIAWWQDNYGASYCTERTVAATAQEIFEVYKKNWANKGASVQMGVQWWMVGDKAVTEPWMQELRLTGAGTTSAAYYSRFYASSFTLLTTSTSIQSCDEKRAVRAANAMAASIRKGYGIGVGIIYADGSYCHALTVWGIAQDGDGYLTEIHFTDSNDHGSLQDPVVTARVAYNAESGSYTLLNTGYKGSVLTTYETYAPFEHTYVIKPSQLRASLKEGVVTFCWKGEQRKGLTYQLAYKLKNEKEYTRVDSPGQSLSLALPADGTYQWAVRAVGSDKRVLTDWAWGTPLVHDAVGPKLTIHGPYLKKQGAGRTRAEFAWTSDEKATYKLAVNGKIIYSGKSLSLSCILSGRSNRYTLKATDSCGNSSVYRGNISCVGGEVSAPRVTSREVLNKGKQVSFSWDPVSSSKPVTYEIRLKGAGNKNYIYRRGYTSAKAVVRFSAQKTWKWAVRAVDSNGYYSSWRAGKAFNNDRTAPVIRFGKVVQQKKSAKRALITIRWTSNEKATFSLVVDGKRVYYGKGKKRNLSLKGGYHSYTLTAKDAAGNRTRKSGRLYCDLTAPTRPTGLTVELNNGGRGVAMNWKFSRDVNDVSYQFAFKKVGAASYAYYNTKETIIGFLLDQNASWTWAVRAVDSRGNRSAWVKGKTFTTIRAASSASSARKTAAPAKAAVALDRELALSSGSTAQSSAAGSAACGYSAATALTGSTGQAEDKYHALLAAC